MILYEFQLHFSCRTDQQSKTKLLVEVKSKFYIPKRVYLFIRVKGVTVFDKRTQNFYNFQIIWISSITKKKKKHKNPPLIVGHFCLTRNRNKHETNTSKGQF